MHERIAETLEFGYWKLEATKAVPARRGKFEHSTRGCHSPWTNIGRTTHATTSTVTASINIWPARFVSDAVG